jgi:hypothetical protein
VSWNVMTASPSGNLSVFFPSLSTSLPKLSTLMPASGYPPCVKDTFSDLLTAWYRCWTYGQRPWGVPSSFASDGGVAAASHPVMYQQGRQSRLNGSSWTFFLVTVY